MDKKALCKNCDHWKFAGSMEIKEPGPMLAANDGNKRAVDVGVCYLNPPNMVFLPGQSKVVSGSVTLEAQRIYPQTMAEETCSHHPAIRLQFFSVQVAAAVKAYFDRLEYDPDKHHVKAGFSRPPSLNEAKNLAGNLNEDKPDES